MNKTLKALLLAGALALAPALALAQSAVLLPNGKQQFLDANGNPLAGGNVGFYVPPNTLTPKTTWQDSGRATPNVNPVPLDSAGEALIYGSGTYRQIVKDSLGNVVWDAQTAGVGGSTYGGTSTGSANAQAITASNFSNQDGQTVSFIAGFTNTGPMTLDAGFGPEPVYRATPTGPAVLEGGEVIAGNAQTAIWSSGSSRFLLTTPTGLPRPLQSMQVWANVNLSATVNANALTISLTAGDGSTISATNPLYLPIQTNNTWDGTNNLVKLTSPLSLTISSGSTVGTRDNTPFGLLVFIANVSGNYELVVYNPTLRTILGSLTIDNYYSSGRISQNIISAEGGGGGADTGATFYGTASSAGVAVPTSLIGVLQWGSGLPTAGTWTAAPTKTRTESGTLTLPLTMLSFTTFALDAVVTGAAVIPEDNTIPQFSEGQGIVATTITPASSTDIICVKADLMLSNSAAGTNSGTILSLFFNSGPNASAISANGPLAAGGVYNGKIESCFMAGTTSAITVQINGGNANAANNITLNGKSGSALYGTSNISKLYITEYWMAG